jgi:hypothetical protein
LLSAGSNSEICLPPGTGKTLIGQMIASLWLNRRTEAPSRVLCVLPNTNLLYQHFAMSNWAYQARLWEPLKIDSKWRSNRQRSHDADLLASRVWFSLPRQLAHALQSADVPRELLGAVSLVILDEYDSFSKAILYDEPHPSLSFKEDMITLRTILDNQQCWYVFMSATPPGREAYRVVDSRRLETVWEKHYSPKFVHIPKSSYSKYIPVARVIPLGVEDAAIYVRDRWIRQEIGKRLRIIQEEIYTKSKQYISTRDLIYRIDSILRFKHVVLPNRIRVLLEGGSIRACQEVKSLKYYRLRLFEDLSGSEPPEHNPFGSIFDDQSQFVAGSKLDALAAVLKTELQDRHQVVVFIRFVETIKSVSGELHAKGIDNGYVFGDLDHSIRESVLGEFRSGILKVLLASRELFGRGFDLPQADTAIFYSPKDNVRTIWQEFLRIRSTSSTHWKRVYVLFYLWTAESSKMKRLLHAMWQHGAERVRRDEPYRYDWEFGEEPRAESVEPDGFTYFDFAADEGTDFWNATEDKQEQQSFYEFGDDRAGHETWASRPEGAVDQSGAVKKFCDALVKSVRMAKLARVPDPLPYLSKLAKTSNVSRHYTEEAIGLLLRRLRDAIVSDEWMSASNVKSRKRVLLMKVHPDHNRNISSEAQVLYNAITMWLIQLL